MALTCSQPQFPRQSRLPHPSGCLTIALLKAAGSWRADDSRMGVTGSPLLLPQPRAAWGISKKGSGSGHYVDTSRQHTHLQHQRVPQQRHLSCSLHGTLTRKAKLTVTTKRHGHTAAQGRRPAGRLLAALLGLLLPVSSSEAPSQAAQLWSLHSEERPFLWTPTQPPAA